MLNVEELGQGFIVPLPRVVVGIKYESVEVVDSSLELAFSLDDVRLTGL